MSSKSKSKTRCCVRGAAACTSTPTLLSRGILSLLLFWGGGGLLNSSDTTTSMTALAARLLLNDDPNNNNNNNNIVNTSLPEISYVLDSFEYSQQQGGVVGSLDYITSSQKSNLSLSEDGLFGNFSLRIEYHYHYEAVNPAIPLATNPNEPTTTATVITRNPDGTTLFNTTFSDEGLLLTSLSSTDVSRTRAEGLRFGWIPPERPHNCYGATHISFWYKILESYSIRNDDDSFTLRLSLLNDNTDDDEEKQYKYYSYVVPVEEDTIDIEEWQQVRVNVDDFSLHEGEEGLSSSFGAAERVNEQGGLNLRRIRGWQIEVTATSTNVLQQQFPLQEGEGNNQNRTTTTTTTTSRDESHSSVVLLLDQLSCVGGGDLLGASFYTDMSWKEAIDQGVWYEEYYQSDYAKNNSDITLNSDSANGILATNYTVQMRELWGGFTALSYFAPEPAYYNLSGATDFHLKYQTKRPVSEPDRTLLRIVLSDGSHCSTNCSTDLFQHERWYSFHYVLADDNTGAAISTNNDADDGGYGEINMPLVGSLDPSTPLWLTKWAGIVGNEELNIDYIKGFTLEFVLDSQGEMNSTVNGAFDMMDLSALVVTRKGTDADGANSNGGIGNDADTCIVESGVNLFFDSSEHLFEHREFVGNICCSLCSEDENCLYGLSTGRDCYLASYIVPDQVGLVNTEASLEVITVFWMNDDQRRGDYCDHCNCREIDQTIDCRGSGLLVMPATIPDDLPWEPRVLDLRNNSNLVILGSDSMSALREGLEEVWIPKAMRHIAPNSLRDLPKLRTIRYEDEDEGEEANLSNAIMKPTDAYSDICCKPGQHVDLLVPSTGISFCDMVVDQAGIDALYLPFIQFPDATEYRSIFPSSKFLFEAAESPTKCAEYCSILEDCKYFSYDQRFPNAEHQCNLLSDNGSGPTEICCSPDHYADEEQTIPGWTAGLPPRTRHVVDDARVYVSPQIIALDPATGYETSFEVSLGSTPLRGAVWVKPTSTISELLSVTFEPESVVLYDSNSTAIVRVRVDGVAIDAKSESLVISNEIESCDVAFMQSSESVANQETTVIIDVDMPQSEDDSDLLLVVVVCLSIFGFVAVAIIVYFENNRKKNDAVWKVRQDELVFADPPEVLGRGTFGLVLKATYRGTDVAVKRVIPPKDQCRRSFASKSLTSLEKIQFADSTASGSIQMDGTRTSHNGRESFNGRMSGTSSMQFGTQESGWRQSLVGMFRNSTVFNANYNKLKKDFVQEMRYLSKLRHPCITTVMGAVINKKSEPMLVMEMMAHGSCYDLLHNETMVIEGEILLPILRDISQGVRFLHAANPQVIHGDLKSQNILVDEKFRAKVADFGLSQKKSVGVTGTPFWMAPELLRGDATNSTASDVYAFGIILYEVYSRKDPYDGEDPQEVLRLVADKKVNKRPPVPNHMPPPIQSLMTDCLVEDPDQRPAFSELDMRLKRVDVKSVEPTQSPSVKNSTSISLFDIFPRHIAEALRDGREVEAEHRDCVTIFFSDIVGFTTISSTLSPRKVANMLDRLYQQFDKLSHKHDLYKVETIGDAYMACGNLVKDQPDDHVRRIAEFAIDAIAAAGTVRIDQDDPKSNCVEIRVGFHSGPVVADVVGTRNPRFCLFGDTVNVASRMESSSKPGKIHCSKASADLLKVQYPTLPLTSRGKIPIKGKGDLNTFWVNQMGEGKFSGDGKQRSEKVECYPDTASLNDIQEEKSGELRFEDETEADLECGEPRQTSRLVTVDKDGFTIGSFVDV